MSDQHDSSRVQVRVCLSFFLQLHHHPICNYHPHLSYHQPSIISIQVGIKMPPIQEAKSLEASPSDGKEAHATQNSQAESTDESAAPKQASGEPAESSDAASKARQRQERFKALQARAVSRDQQSVSFDSSLSVSAPKWLVFRCLSQTTCLIDSRNLL